MTSRPRLFCGFMLSGVVLIAPASAQHVHHTPSDAAAEAVGTVIFTTSCRPAVQERFNRAVALLHSFWFPAAIEAFDAVLEADSSCAMAWWGKALSYWGNPYAASRPPQALQAGLDAVTRGRALRPATERERAYVDAVATLFEAYETRSNAERALAYEQAMEDVYRRFADDTEAAIFYALALTQTAPPTDKNYTKLKAAGAILEPLYARQPDHPGLAHYIIHAYDVPALADRALVAARRYASIAPAVPHALHMPSHTFTRVGSWTESIASNLASAEAARLHKSTAEELHALDYQVYAYLQLAQDQAAARVKADVPSVLARLTEAGTASAAPPVAGYYAAATIPARYALERGAWAEAAALPIQTSRVPFADAVNAFARALGAARSGRATDARADLARLETLRGQLQSIADGYWSEQAEIGHLAASAWVRLAGNDAQQALALAREAADREAATEKSAISPGPLAPARELLAELLLQLGQHADAHEQFERVLTSEPNRFRSLYGAAKTAALTGDAATARARYGALVEMCAEADDPPRAELREARTYLHAR